MSLFYLRFADLDLVGLPPLSRQQQQHMIMIPEKARMRRRPPPPTAAAMMITVVLMPEGSVGMGAAVSAEWGVMMVRMGDYEGGREGVGRGG